MWVRPRDLAKAHRTKQSLNTHTQHIQVQIKAIKIKKKHKYFGVTINTCVRAVWDLPKCKMQIVVLKRTQIYNQIIPKYLKARRAFTSTMETLYSSTNTMNSLHTSTAEMHTE